MISRFLTFLLVPFYTHVLVPGEYGIVALAYTYIAFFGIVFNYGMESAYFRFAAGENERFDRTTFSTPFVSLLVSSILLAALTVAFAPALARLVDPHGSVAYDTMTRAVQCCAGILLCDTLCVLPFAALRLQHRPVRFSVIRVLSISLQVGLNIVFLVVLHWGVIGIFIGNMISAAITLVMLSPTIIRMFTPVFSKALWKELLAFGLPYLPSGLSLMMLQVIDRPILQALTDDAHVGIYQANYRLGIVMMVFVSMFEFAWRPFFLQHASQPDAKRVFARVLTYFTVAGAMLFLAVSFYVEPMAHLPLFGRTLIDAKYWSGLTIVPIVLAAYLFNGWYTNMIAGVYIEKRTRQLPWITGVGAASNVVANVLLIPSFGIAGAAWATLISYALMSAMMFLSTRRYYPVPYEWRRIGLIAIATLVFFCAEMYLRTALSGGALQGVRLVLLTLFVASFFVMRFFSPDERAVIARVFDRIRGNGRHDAA